MKNPKSPRKTPDLNFTENQPDPEIIVCSAQDCTGLIPSAVQNGEQADSYEQIYPYVTPPAPPKNKGE